MERKTILRKIPSDFQKYKESWDTYKTKFKKTLNDFDSSTTDLIKDIIDLPENSESEDIASHEKSILLYTIYRFVRGKNTVIEEYVENKNGLDSDEYGDFDNETCYFVALDQIQKGKENILYKILLFYLWSKYEIGRTYEIEDELPLDYRERFDKDSRGLRMTLANRTRGKKYLYQERDKIEFENSTIFVIDRQASDKEKRDVVGTIRRRRLRSIFIMVDEAENEIEIKADKEKIRQIIAERIQKTFVVSLKPSDVVESESKVDVDSFSNKLKGEETRGEIDIVNVEFRKTNARPSVPLTVSKKSVGIEIRPLVKKLSEGIVSSDIKQVKKFWFQVDDVDTRVKIKNKPDGSVRLESKIKTHSSEKKEGISKKFLEEFGVPLDQDIPPHLVEETRESIISFLLNRPPSHELYPSYSDLMSKLEDLGVLNVDVIKRNKCEECEEFYENREDCPRCGNSLSKVSERKKVDMSRKGVTSFFKDLLNREDIEYIGKKRERIYKSTYNFIKIQKGDINLHVLIDTPDLSITEKSIQHLKKSVNPVLIVEPGDSVNEKLIEETHSTYLNLAEALDKYLDEELPSDYISTHIEEVVRSVGHKLASNAKDSYDRLEEMIRTPSNSDPTQFEKEIFHIINQIIPFAAQWGTKRSGKRIPDGFAELTYRKKGKIYSRSIAWDSKFKNDDSEFDIDSEEANNIRGYIHKIKESEEVKTSKTLFRNFLVITNAKNPGNFSGRIASLVNRMRSWRGVPVLVDIRFLLGLHVVFNENLSLIKRSRATFNEILFKTINGGQYRYKEVEKNFFVYLEGKDVKDLFSEFEKEIDSNRIDLTSLRKFLEKDIFP